jgi:hypothetical protein
MKRLIVLGGLVLGAAAAPGLAAAAPSPNLPGCPRPEQPEAGERQRKTPLPVPTPLRGTLRSSLHHYALPALGGGLVCIDTSWMETVENLALSADGRFLTFGWIGYETYGYKLVDRTGRGKAIEIGAKPVFSPSRRQFAAIDQTESEFGSLSGLALWSVGSAGVTEGAKVPDIPRMYNWRIDGWVGEACLNLSAVPFSRMQGESEDVSKLRRDRFVAKPVGRTWRVLPASAANRCPAA